ncbi:MAG: OmpH family outer membrane protein [Gammaproteobacteria bacterium]|nr:OmpH family outer membrane protein [Gammaproteobacteria bacterium]NNE06388.1 OmpH family outer membrane protein [Xanthomonadales bacterium]NNM01834.1 OmpH family outer membrane protein [Gammaproteobacteria bacterium]
MLRTVALALLMGVVFTATAHGQVLRIGYVNMKEVLDNAPQVIAGREKLDQEFRPRNDAIENEEIRVSGMEQRLQQGDLTDEARNRLEREIREIRRNINRQKEDLRDELSFRRTEEVQQLEDQINIAVQQIARNHGYDLILSSPVVYADEALDITDLILQQLQLEFEADQLELAQP